jgi:hypothetical protein
MQVRRLDATQEMELRGTSEELTGLAGLLISGHGSVDLDHVDDPSPYGRCLARVDVVRASGPVVVVCAPGSDVLDIRGGSAQLDLLAANIEGFAAEGDVTSHLHIDYLPEHDYLDESAEPLVIALTG